MMLLFQKDTREYTPGMYAKPPRREEASAVSVGVNPRHSDVSYVHSCFLHLEDTCRREVNVGFRPRSGTDAGWEAGVAESIRHLFAHLKTTKGYAWTDYGMQIFGIAAKVPHGIDRLCDNPLHGTTPSRMDSRCQMVLGIVKQHRDAVGRGNTDADSPEIRHQSICIRQRKAMGARKVFRIYTRQGNDLVGMYLMGQHQVLVQYAQFFTEFIAARCHVYCGIATIVCDIEARIGIAGMRFAPKG